MIMNLKTVVIAVLCFSYAVAGGHERKKWVEWKEKPDEECDEAESEELGSSSIGSVPGTPGEDYPSLTEIPNTGFICPDKDGVPGFYPDMETGCQVFHVCYENRRESFLCPVGTIFSAPLKTCDYWYSADCLESPKGEGSSIGEMDKESEIIIIKDPIIEELINAMLHEISPHKTGSTVKSASPKYAETTKYREHSATMEPWTKQALTPTKAELTEIKSSSTKDYQLGDKYPATKDSAKKSDVAKSMKETAEIASVILQSLLPVKSKVVQLIAEESRKSKSGDAASNHSDKLVISKPTAVPTADSQKPTIKQTAQFTTHKPRVVPRIRPARIEVPVKTNPVWRNPPKQSVSPYSQYFATNRETGLPISLLTRKLMALDYAKLWKLKKLGNPIMALLKAV